MALRQKELPMSYKRILVPVDASSTSTRGMKEAVRLAKAAHARLMLLHVLDEYPALSMPESGVAAGAILDGMRESGERLLQKNVKAVTRSGIKPQSAMVESTTGGIAGVVVKEAKRWKADLIVVGSHSRDGVARALLGSAAESIARESPVPVLVVPARTRK
jgi:nucleotide-binding universal stress UspA family protein